MVQALVAGQSPAGPYPMRYRAGWRRFPDTMYESWWTLGWWSRGPIQRLCWGELIDEFFIPPGVRRPPSRGTASSARTGGLLWSRQAHSGTSTPAKPINGGKIQDAKRDAAPCPNRGVASSATAEKRPLAEATIGKRVSCSPDICPGGSVEDDPATTLLLASRAAAKSTSPPFFITRDVADAVIAACPDAQWKLLFALSSFTVASAAPLSTLPYAGATSFWDKDRIRETCVQTSGHEGRKSAFVPIFPELPPPANRVR